jgi:two-component system, OmpR family, response regulator
MAKILVVDDDKNILDVLKYNLLQDGFITVTAEDGIQALELARREKPDLILLDIMLPGIDGFEVCRILRKEMPVPILMLTAKTEEIDKVVGLELGADDYITKPFSIRELMARVRAMVRRSHWNKQSAPVSESTAQPVLTAANLEVDVSGHRVFYKGQMINLSPKEFGLLAFLMRHRGQVFNREQLVEQIWGYEFGGTARTVDVHILSLRRKIGDSAEKPEHLLTVHGLGYKFEG